MTFFIFSYALTLHGSEKEAVPEDNLHVDSHKDSCMLLTIKLKVASLVQCVCLLCYDLDN